MIYVDGNEYSFLNRWQETGRSGRPTRITPAEINDFSGGLFLVYCGGLSRSYFSHLPAGPSHTGWMSQEFRRILGGISGIRRYYSNAGTSNSTSLSG